MAALLSPETTTASRASLLTAMSGGDSLLSINVDDVVDAKSTSSQSVAEPVQLQRWCNHMYTGRCPQCAPQADERCRYMHVDTYVNMDREVSLALGMPNLMTRHMKALAKEMIRIVNEEARRVLNEYIVVKAWESEQIGDEELPSPYLDTVKALRHIGWVIPTPPDASTSLRLEDAPYAKDVTAILTVAASSLHYNVASSTPIMFETVSWVLGRQTTTMPSASPTHEDFTISEVAAGLDVPPVLDILSEYCDSSQDMSENPELGDHVMRAKNAAKAKDEAPGTTRKERREKRFALFRQQKAQKAKEKRAFGPTQQVLTPAGFIEAKPLEAVLQPQLPQLNAFLIPQPLFAPNILGGTMFV